MSKIQNENYIEKNSTNVNNQVLFIQTDFRDKLILNILTDFVMWQRISNAMHSVINCFKAEENDFQPEYHYNGYANALDYLGITDGVLRSDLATIVFEELNKDTDAPDAAVAIYSKWLKMLQDYTLSNLKAVV